MPHRSTRPLRRPLAALIVVVALALVAPVASPGTSPAARSATAGAGSPAPGTATTAGRGTAVAEEPPNVVMVLTDDMRKDDMRHMPHVRELLVDRGMTFRQAQSPHPLCCPARAEILSGQYAQNNGVHHNSGPYGGWQAFDPRSTIATWAQDEGYRTALHGKHLNHFERGLAGRSGLDQLRHPARAGDRLRQLRLLRRHLLPQRLRHHPSRPAHRVRPRALGGPHAVPGDGQPRGAAHLDAAVGPRRR